MGKVILSYHNGQKAVVMEKSTRSLIKKCCEKTLEPENFIGDAEISVTITDNAEIRKLNAEYRDIDRETDVLSFPLGENGEYDLNPDTNAFMLGDIVISAEKASAQSKEYGHSLEREIAFLCVHSTLHLLGYDHVTSEEDEKVMLEKQKNILELMGITR